MGKRFGGTGKILRVDISEKTVDTEEIDPLEQEQFIGGRGINGSILYRSLTGSIEPFDPQNLLVFGAGPLVGTLLPANGRFNVSSRSPLTSLLGDANAAGLWAPLLKKTGFDGIAVRGRSENPVYLLVTEEKVEIRDASLLWGRTVSETDRELRKQHGQRAHVSAIGPAGENLVRFASVMTDVDRAAGRTGNGAVMGSKRLKAIVVSGRRPVPVADPDKVRSLAQEIKAAMVSAPSFRSRSQLGTPMVILLYNQMGVLPAKNHQTGIFAGAEKISGERLREKYVARLKSCYGCPIHCSRFSEVKKGKFGDVRVEGPEFETLCFMGSNLMNGDLESIVYLNRRLNDLGMDSISTGGTIAYAMECYENGLIKREDVDGLDLGWGNVEAVLQLVEGIAYRRGFGDLLVVSAGVEHQGQVHLVGGDVL
ncbi:MAG: aldehyde ferredoxin oxidoreductase, partial [Deltaproteobacteria bacterium]